MPPPYRNAAKPVPRRLLESALWRGYQLRGPRREVGGIEIDGSLDARDCTVVCKKGGRTLATVTISRDVQSLQAEAAMEAEIRSQKRDFA